MTDATLFDEPALKDRTDPVLNEAAVAAAKVIPAQYGPGLDYWRAVARAVRDVLMPEPPADPRNPVAAIAAALDLPERCECGAAWFKVDGALGHDAYDPRPVEFTCGEGHPWRVMPNGALSDVDAKSLGPFARDSETSRQAALANYPRQGTQRWLILRYLFDRQEEGRPGCTREELAIELGMSPDAVRPRVVELRRGGWICAVASGARTRRRRAERRSGRRPKCSC